MGQILTHADLPYLDQRKVLDVKDLQSFYRGDVSIRIAGGAQGVPGYWNTPGADLSSDQAKNLLVQLPMLVTRTIGMEIKEALWKLVPGVTESEKRRLLIFQRPPLLELGGKIDVSWTNDRYFNNLHRFGPNAGQNLHQYTAADDTSYPFSATLQDDFKLNFKLNFSAAVASGQILVEQFDELFEIETGNRQFSARYALFFIADDQFEVFYIGFGQSPSDVFETNLADDAREPRLQWIEAKMRFNNSYMNYHESVTHLLNTHLLLEALSVTTMAVLEDGHPIRQLLEPHVYFTQFINAAGRHTLINKTGLFARVFTLGYAGLNDLLRHHWQNEFANTWANIGPDDRINSCFPTPATQVMIKRHVPYWRAAGQYYTAIKAYVTEYMTATYGDMNADVDEQAQTWLRFLRSPDASNCNFLTRNDYSVSYVVDVLTRFIYQASVGHATANFGQNDYYCYTPLTSPYLRQQVPFARAYDDVEHMIEELLPSHAENMEITRLIRVLSSPTDVPLGRFLDQHFGNNPKLREIAVRFQRNLNKINDCMEVDERYPYLIADRICQSVSI